MKREEWEKTTGKKFIKERGKIRRSQTAYSAMIAYQRIVDTLNVYQEQIEGRPNLDASARKSSNAALAAIVKLGRRFMPLFAAAQNELDRRHEATIHGREVQYVMDRIVVRSPGIDLEAKLALSKQRRKELKRAYKKNH